jgi:hypothetical protein
VASRPDSFPYEAKIRDLVVTYRRAQQEIAKEIRRALLDEDLRQAQHRAAQLAKVIEVLDRLGVHTDPLLRRIVAEAFTQSADRVQTQIGRLAVDAPEIPGAFAGVSEDAVRVLQDSITGRLQTARGFVGRSVDDLYARAGRRAALRSVLGADGSARTAKKRLMQDLMRDPQIRRTVMRGGAGFVDRSGRQWALQDYADMVVRTTTREAVVQGAISRMAGHGITLARVTRHASSCPVCKPWEGRLVTLDGETTDYEGEAVADLSALPNGGPPFHPRCRHTISPVSTRLDAFRRELAAA